MTGVVFGPFASSELGTGTKSYSARVGNGGAADEAGPSSSDVSTSSRSPRPKSDADSSSDYQSTRVTEDDSDAESESEDEGWIGRCIVM